jgi:hypothetical protein
MTWLEAIDVLTKGCNGTKTRDDCVRLKMQDVDVRASYSSQKSEIGLVADVATAEGITEREIAAAGKGVKEGRLVAVSGRILISHRVSVDALRGEELARMITTMVSHVTRLRFQWSMPMIAA